MDVDTLALVVRTPASKEEFLQRDMSKVSQTTRHTCAICFEEFSLDDYAVQIAGLNNASHMFGRQCITTWLYVYAHNICPLCSIQLYTTFPPPRPAPARSPANQANPPPPHHHHQQLPPISPRHASPSSLDIDITFEVHPPSRYPGRQAALQAALLGVAPRSAAAQHQRNTRLRHRLAMARDLQQHTQPTTTRRDDPSLDADSSSTHF
ncbi:hypothetical protein ACEQ8H_000632 [Pleosporales sp. CAS-2024a]